MVRKRSIFISCYLPKRPMYVGELGFITRTIHLTVAEDVVMQCFGNE